jgi:hypothetical protein
VELTRCGTALSVAFLFEPKLGTKTSLRGEGGCLVITRQREELPEEGVERRNTTETRLSDRTAFHHVSHGNEITRTRHGTPLQ